MARSNRSKTTPIDFSALAICSVYIGVLVYLFLDNLESINKATNQALPPYMMYLFLIILFTILAAMTLVHYSFTERYLIVRFLGIPVRRIYWRSVSHAIYARQWRESGGKIKYKFALSSMKGNAIFVSLHGCPPYDPERDARSDFSMINGRNALCIFLPPKTAEEYVAVFKERFPDLIVQ